MLALKQQQNTSQYTLQWFHLPVFLHIFLHKILLTKTNMCDPKMILFLHWCYTYILNISSKINWAKSKKLFFPKTTQGQVSFCFFSVTWPLGLHMTHSTAKYGVCNGKFSSLIAWDNLRKGEARERQGILRPLQKHCGHIKSVKQGNSVLRSLQTIFFPLIGDHSLHSWDAITIFLDVSQSPT